MATHDTLRPQTVDGDTRPPVVSSETDVPSSESEVEVEFLGELEDVTAGWSGPTGDFIDGDFNW